MSLGLGHNYLIHIIKHFYGKLDECINYINNNKPQNNKQWYELRPSPNLKEGTCNEYHCDLVELAK